MVVCETFFSDKIHNMLVKYCFFQMFLLDTFKQISSIAWGKYTVLIGTYMYKYKYSVNIEVQLQAFQVYLSTCSNTSTVSTFQLFVHVHVNTIRKLVQYNYKLSKCI